MKNIPTFENFIEDKIAFGEDTLNETYYATSKDRDRISDIVKKSKGSALKEVSLSVTMANSIKDYGKAIGRAEAAVTLKKYEIAQVFIDRAKTLPHVGNEYPIVTVQRDVNNYMTIKRNRENYEAHLKGLEGKPDTNPDGIFYNVGIPILHNQIHANDVKLFSYAITRIVQNLVGQEHVYVMPQVYNEKKQELEVEVTPNFTYPKAKLNAAFKEYPKVLADFLNKAYGEPIVKVVKLGIVITKDINHNLLLKAVTLTDLERGNLKLPEDY